MSIALALTIVALCWAMVVRWKLRERVGLDAFVLIAALLLSLVGIVTTLLATFGQATPTALAIALGTIALAWMPWRSHREPLPPRGKWQQAIVPLAIALGAIALRWPPMDHPLAGRDQGSYALRAEITAKDGAIAFVDPVLAQAAAAADTRPGPQDLLGLYPRRGERWREDVYEAGYRPGWYLADREAAVVVPQFLHLHPMTLTVARMIGGRAAPGALVVIEGVLAVLAVLAIARRLWSGSVWPACAAAAFALAPLSIWVQRNTLSEALTGLLLAAAVLAALRARVLGDRELLLAAWLLGALAWVRGNAWMTAPIVLAVLWLEPADARARHRATLVFLGSLGAAVMIHAGTSFPYLSDELRRQLLGWSEPSPFSLVLGCGVAMLVWWSVDELGFGPRARFGEAAIVARVRELLPPIFGALALLGLVVWAMRAVGSDAPPWSRLDALGPGLGAALLGPAALGLVLAVARWRVRDRADLWLAAIAALVAATIWIYAGRNLPKFGLYYYGRYLVPEILPLACLAGTHALVRIHAMLPRPRVTMAALAVVWLGAIAWPLVRTPQTRLREQDGSGRIVDALAELVPPDAIVIAGGEGWHHGHTFNQVGGALAIGHGRVVLPYHTREAAYASAHELLVEGPRARDESPPRVFVLVNEATHAVRGPDDPAALAAFDDLFPPPLRARQAVMLELVTDRLTPSEHALPTAVTRDALRMALVELELDPTRMSEVQRVWFGARAGGDDDDDALAIRVESGKPAPQLVGDIGKTELCLSDRRDVELVLDPSLAAGTSSVVLVATPGASDETDRWRVIIDGVERPSVPVGMSPRARDTLGPFAVREPPRSIRVRGSRRAIASATCPNGGIAELRLLGPDHAASDDVAIATQTFAPSLDLGHPVVPARWVPGRGLSRYRPGIVPTPELRALSLALRSDAPLQLAPEALPHGEAIDVVVNLTGAELDPAARILILVDGEPIGAIDPPEQRNKSWQSPPLRFVPKRDVVVWRLELVDASADDVAWVRDIGLFSRER